MDWVCSSCGRHFNWSVSECPHCRFQTTVTTGGTQPTSDNSDYAAALKVYLEWAGDVTASGCPGSAYDFHNWLNQRLHSEEPNVA